MLKLGAEHAQILEKVLRNSLEKLMLSDGKSEAAPGVETEEPQAEKKQTGGTQTEEKWYGQTHGKDKEMRHRAHEWGKDMRMTAFS